MERRDFLTISGSAAVNATLLGANNRIRGAIIGSGLRGQLLTAEFKEIGVEMAGVCDVYEPNLAAGLKAASSGARSFDDYRKLLEDKSIEVVVIATPDHWHAQMAIDAVEAGKDVYLEKPMVRTPDEGFHLIEAVRRTRRVLQVGTQRRSFDLFHEAAQIAHSGRLGEVRLVNAWWINFWRTLVPGGLEGKLDWEKWQGNAPKRPPDPVRFRNWVHFRDYSGGIPMSQAAHIIDAIHWLMQSRYPAAVTYTAVRPNVQGAENPETASMAIEYPKNYLAVFTVGYRAMHYNSYLDQMKQFHGTKARFDVSRESYALYPETEARELKAVAEAKRPGAFNSATRAHIRNFIDCVRSRRDPNAPVEAGQWTSVVLAMAGESLRLGRRVRWDGAKIVT